MDSILIVSRVVDHFSEISEVEPAVATLSNIQYTSKMWRYWMTQEPADFNQLLGNGVKLNGFMELTKKLIGKGEFTMASIYSLIDEYLPKENADKIKEYTRKCDEELTVTVMELRFYTMKSNEKIFSFPESTR